MKLLFLVVVLTVAIVFTNAKEAEKDDSESSLTEKELARAISDDKICEKRDAEENGDEITNEILNRETRSEDLKRVFYKIKNGHRIKFVLITRHENGGQCAALKRFYGYRFLYIYPYKKIGMIGRLVGHRSVELLKRETYYTVTSQSYDRKSRAVLLHRYIYKS